LPAGTGKTFFFLAFLRHGKEFLRNGINNFFLLLFSEQQNLAELAQFGVSGKIDLKEPEQVHLHLTSELHLNQNVWHDFVPSQNPELNEKTPPYEGSV
jgi:hypothetical protein